RVVRMILVIALDCAGGDVESDGGSGVEIVTGTIVADGRTAVSGSEVRQVRLGIVIPGDPHRGAAGFPLIAAGGPSVAAGFARRGHGERAPDLFAGFGIKRRYKAPDSEFASRGSHQDLPIRNQRSERGVVTGFVVGDDTTPDFGAGLGIQSHQHGFTRADIYLIAVERDAAIHFVGNVRSLGTWPAIAP